jgi:alpha-tubulin suppressor-like RCC1 family protein
MNSNTFSSKPSAWFETKVFSLFSLIFISLFLVGCGSGSGGGTGSGNDITGFSFPSGVIKSTTIDENTNSIDVTIDYNSNELKPIVNHNGADYSPKEPIDFTKVTMPIEYNITAANGDVKSYTVTVRRGFVVSTEEGLISAIDNIIRDIDDKSSSTKYITILITKDINLKNKITLPANWAGRNITIENNSNASTVSVVGLESNGTVELTGVNDPAEPVRVGGEVIIKAIAAGNKHSIALDSNGQIWTAGGNANGELGLDYTGELNDEIGRRVTNHSFKPVTIPDLPSNAKITSIAAGGAHSLALDSNGKLWATGYSGYGQLGLGNTNSQNSFQLVTFTGLSPNAKITSIAAGETYSLALDSNGQIWAAGENEYGQLGLGDNIDRNSFRPVTIPDLAPTAKIISIAAGGYHSIALDSNGKLWATGSNGNGRLGLGYNIDQNEFKPVAINGLSSSTNISIAAGGYHSLALDSNGQIWATGSNYWGQLGLGDEDAYSFFTQVPSLPDYFVSIAANDQHSLALDNNGQIWAAGQNVYGRLGLGSSNNYDIRYFTSFQPVIIPDLASSGAKIVYIAAGGDHSLALDGNGQIWATGYNTVGQLGLGSEEGSWRYTFKQVVF